MTTTKLTVNNKYLLEEFLANLGNSQKTFTYFQNRNKSAVDNHVITFIEVLNEIPVAYGHLDKDGDKVWLGIAVSASYQRKGLGNKMMNQLITSAKEHYLSVIYLSVFKHNHTACRLFEKFGFKRLSETENSYFYHLVLEE